MHFIQAGVASQGFEPARVAAGCSGTNRDTQVNQTDLISWVNTYDPAYPDGSQCSVNSTYQRERVLVS